MSVYEEQETLLERGILCPDVFQQSPSFNEWHRKERHPVELPGFQNRNDTGVIEPSRQIHLSHEPFPRFRRKQGSSSRNFQCYPAAWTLLFRFVDDCHASGN